MKKVLLTHSYYLLHDPKQNKLNKPYPPLGTLLVAQILLQNNFEVIFIDAMFLKSSKDVIEEIEIHQPDYVVVYDDGFNYLTKMCLSNMRTMALELLSYCKKKNISSAICSSDSTDHPELYLGAGANVVVLGEGEITLLEWLIENRNNNNGFELSKIDGLAYQTNNEIITGRKRPIMTSLDDLPFAAWELLNIEPYRERWIKNYSYFSINMYTTRGCPFSCNWCAKPIYGNRYNARSPEKVIAELKHIQTLFQFDHVWFCDDIFGLKPGWMTIFHKELQHAKFHFKYKIQSRADLLLKEETIVLLSKTGCDEVWMGAESGSQKILDAMDKGISVQQIIESTYLLKSHKIKPCYFIQFGYTNENIEDINKTIQLVLSQMPYDIGVSVSYPLPGTKFHEKVKNDLISKTNWNDSDELVLLFKNTYPSPFYKILQRYLHRRFRTKQSVVHLKQLFNGKNKNSVKSVVESLKYFYHYPIAIALSLQLKRYIRQ